MAILFAERPAMAKQRCSLHFCVCVLANVSRSRPFVRASVKGFCVEVNKSVGERATPLCITYLITSVSVLVHK